MGAEYIISFDVGTSGVKAALVSLDGELVSSVEKGYPLITPKSGWAEQAPVDYWDALCVCTRSVVADMGAAAAGIAGISLCTQWKGIIPVDSEGNVLHNSLIWLDARAEEEAKLLNARMGTRNFTGQSYWARLMWLKRNRADIYERAETIFEANSFLRWKLTGIRATDISNDFIHSYDPTVDAYYHQILEAAGIDKAKFPPLVQSTAMVGTVTQQAGKALGLPAGLPVFAGCSDIPAVAIGAGCGERNMAHAYLGTSGWVASVVEHKSEYVHIPSAAFRQQDDIVMFGMQSVGLALNWTIAQFYNAEQKQLGKGIFDLLEQELAGVPAGSDRLLATPWLSGELPPLSERARVAFLNGSAVHDRRHFVNAMMESICYSIRQRIQQCEGLLGHPLEEITAVGGGASGSHWMQMLADVLQIPVLVPQANQHTGAIGGAYCALMGLGVCRDLSEIRQKVWIAKRYEPNRENWEEYQRMYEAFTGLYSALEPVFLQLQM